jgi:hypothetical protein
MFREVAITMLAITGVGILLHALTVRGAKTSVADTPTACPWGRLIRGGSAVLVLACVLGLAITGFYSRLILNTALSGYLLIIHVSLGGAFVAAMTVFSVTWASDHWDLYGLWVRKAAFWMLVIGMIPMTLAVLLNMFPLIGTEWQGGVVNIHRYGGLISTICGLIWGYLVIRKVNT